MVPANKAPEELPEQYAMCIISIDEHMMMGYYDPDEGWISRGAVIAQPTDVVYWHELNTVWKLLFGNVSG